MKTQRSTLLLTFILTVFAVSAWVWHAVEAQVKTDALPIVPGAKPVAVERIKIHANALEGNLEGDAVDRDTLFFLPPSYAREKSRRYPVVYALHGYSIGAEQWTHEIQVPQAIKGAFALGSQDMIVGLPDSKTVHNGSLYSSSFTTGDFEQFIAHDVGDQDGLRVGAGKFHGILDSYGITNTFDLYHGTHTSAVADRFQNHVLPFFGTNLCVGKGCR